MRWLFVLQERRESKYHKHEKTGSAGQSRSFQATLPPPHASTKAATAHCSIIVSFCHMMAKACAVERDALVGTLPPCTGVSSRSRPERCIVTIASLDQWLATIEKHRYQWLADWKPLKNHWSQWLSRYHSINGNGHLKNHWFKVMVVMFCLYVWLKLISNKQMLTAQVLVKKMWDWLKM